MSRGAAGSLLAAIYCTKAAEDDGHNRRNHSVTLVLGQVMLRQQIGLAGGASEGLS
jgi:hypothetical protein